MRAEKIFSALSDVSDKYIEEAQNTKLKRQSTPFNKWAAIAACVIALVGIGSAILLQSIQFGGSGTGGNPSEGAGGAGHNEGAVFMSYAGPVFPLTLKREDAGISAERSITYDFALTNEDYPRLWGAGVEDSYTITNPAGEEKTVSAVYPFAGSYSELSKLMPEITAGGKAVSPTLHAGDYSGTFHGLDGDDDTQTSHNLLQLNSWEGYKRLLEDGAYQGDAFAGYPVLSQTVTVYTFSDFTAPQEYDAATQAISFTIDPDKTTVLAYGFEGVETSEDGFRRYSYFVPNGVRRSSDAKFLIVIGEDIADYSLQGYQDGGCEEGEELSGVSATVTRTENALSDVLGEAIGDYFLQNSEDEGLTVSRDMFVGAVSDYLLRYGPLSGNVRDRYEPGMLYDIISEAYVVNRVFYLEFDVTIPAGETVEIRAALHKEPSYDFGGSGSENEGIQGHDMVTKLGTNLRFDALSAELRSFDNIEIVRQNFGFDLKNDITQVELDPYKERYYIEVRPVVSQ